MNQICYDRKWLIEISWRFSMRKKMYFFIILTAFMLSGCSKKEQIVNFIPTQAPEGDAGAVTEDTSETEVPDENAATPTPKGVVIGQTTPMYVKLDEYGGYLNVRSTPSTKGEVMGFLVHAEKTDVIEIVDGWASIVYEDKICYVNADYLVTERPAYLDPPTPTPVPETTPTQAPGQAPPEI
jgi:hypothetical protein